MGQLLWHIITRLVDADKLGGWTRAFVASLIALLLAKWPALAAIFTPDMQAAVAVAISGVVVGIWSQIAKTMGPPSLPKQ